MAKPAAAAASSPSVDTIVSRVVAVACLSAFSTSTGGLEGTEAAPTSRCRLVRQVATDTTIATTCDACGAILRLERSVQCEDRASVTAGREELTIDRDGPCRVDRHGVLTLDPKNAGIRDEEVSNVNSAVQDELLVDGDTAGASSDGRAVCVDVDICVYRDVPIKLTVRTAGTAEA